VTILYTNSLYLYFVRLAVTMESWHLHLYVGLGHKATTASERPSIV